MVIERRRCRHSHPRKEEPPIRRKQYRPVPRDRGPRRNKAIRVSPLRVIDQDNQQVGVIEREEALRLAEEAGLDLVEVNPNVRPPVCKIVDYGKYKYDLQKKQKGVSTPKINEVKQVRLGRSMKIDDHDLDVRLQQARKFLRSGHRVMVIQRFRGREMVHTELGYTRLAEIKEQLSDISKVQSPATLSGRQLSMMLVPQNSA